MALNFNHLLDDTGWRLLSLLQNNARLSYSELGRQIGLSTPAVIERVRKLESAGIISGYQAKVDIEKLGIGIIAFISLNTVPEKHTSIIDFLKKAPEVQESHYITGQASFMIKIASPDVQQLEKFIDRLSKFGTTNTSIVMSTNVDHRYVTEMKELLD